MNGICGWTSLRERGEDSLQMLSRMLGRDAKQFPENVVSTHTNAIAAIRGIVPAEAKTVGDVLVALEGRPYWSSPEDKRKASASALAEAYQRSGIDCLQSLRGSFALALIDIPKGTALLAVDRAGTRPLCYCNPTGALVFGSSAESVAAHPKVGRKLDPQAIYNYLYCHVVPSPDTIFQGITKLRPGEYAVFRNGITERHFYWQLRYGSTESTGSAPLEERFRKVLRDAALRSIGSDERIGAFLSGGTDSSTVAGLLTELRGRPAKTYSIGFGAEGFDEMAYARISARHFGTESHEYYVTPRDVTETIPLVAAAYDEPFGNASAVPTYLCAKMARSDGIDVMLAGDGGDELFGGNARYATQKLFEAYRAVPKPLRLVLEPAVLGLPAGDRLPFVRKVRSYIRQARIPLPDRLESYNFLERSALTDVFEADFLDMINPRHPLEVLRETYRRTASDAAVERMMHLDLTITLADNDLRKVSRMCERAGVEARYPLLDDALIEFSGEVPAHLKVHGRKLRYFFKQALKDYLPAETIAKAKHGFGLPFGQWLKHDPRLAGLVRDHLDAFQRRGIVRPSYISSLLRQHAEDHATYFGVMIWVVMMLECWLSQRKL